MKLKIFILTCLLSSTGFLFSQTLEPVITIHDNPISYSMHICTDGTFYYTVNGGIEKDGQISKFKLNGEFVASYPIAQDMRSIMYNKRDKSLYINTKNKEIYKLVDMEHGIIQLLYSGIYDNDQSTLAIDPNGKWLYAMSNGDLSVISFKTGKPVRQISGLKCGNKGMKGSTTVAVDKKYLYTWDTDTRTVYAYTKDGIFKKSFVLKDGNIGHSLSAAYGMIFTAKSEMGKPANWFGYQLSFK
jgi:DNA-binding beta-propeller fold protein YncE